MSKTDSFIAKIISTNRITIPLKTRELLNLREDDYVRVTAEKEVVK